MMNNGRVFFRGPLRPRYNGVTVYHVFHVPRPFFLQTVDRCQILPGVSYMEFNCCSFLPA